MVTVSMCGDVCLNMLMGAIEVEGPSRTVAGVARDNSCVCQRTEAEEGCRGVKRQ